MHRLIYEALIEVARTQNLITYSDIAPLAGLDMSSPGDRVQIGAILDEISTREHEQGRPLLSAVVVLKETSMPRQGFFSLARDLGLHVGTDDRANLTFFSKEVKRVQAAWK